MLPSTVDRVPAHTAEFVNERIREQTEANIAVSAQAVRKPSPAG
jgi:tRNA nucleotidyltransferase (CCA-adding enzyme)